MLSWFKNRRRRLIQEISDESARKVHDLRYEIVHAIFSDVGVDRIEEIIKQARKNQHEIGHCDYFSLAKLYIDGIKR